MKSFTSRFLSFVLSIALLLSVLCCGGTSAAFAAASGTHNVIRIIVDDDTFKNYYIEDYEKVYCMIYDETADEDVSSWMSSNAEMAQVGESNTWSYDLDEHGITLDSSHLYTVMFAADLIKAMTDELVIENYDPAKDYTAVFTELFTHEAFTEVAKYQYKWIGENEFDVGMDIIRINADKNTFAQPVDRLYCRIVDETAYEEVIEMGRMTKEADSDIWYFDLGEHGVVPDPEHTYTVKFHDGRAESAPLTIGAYDRAEDYTAVFTGMFIHDDVTGMNLSEYKWINDAVILYGDADCDGEVTIIDATVIQRILVNMAWEPFNEKAADVDGEGLDIIDATLIRRFLLGLINRFPVEEPAAFLR